ncbi:hypothetical protein [Rubritalea tangerina]
MHTSEQTLHKKYHVYIPSSHAAFVIFFAISPNTTYQHLQLARRFASL